MELSSINNAIQSLKRGCYTSFSFIYKILEPYYYSIPGKDRNEKISTIALKALKVSPWIVGGFVLYPWITKKIQVDSLLLYPLTFLPYGQRLHEGLLFVNYQAYFVAMMKSLKEPASLMQRFESAAILYASFSEMAGLVISLSQSDVIDSEEPKKPSLISSRSYQRQDRFDLGSLIQILDDYGLTYGDYAKLDCLFKSDDQSPFSLKERVASHLHKAGLPNAQAFIQKGIIPPQIDRQSFSTNLLRYLMGETQAATPHLVTTLPTIRKIQRIAAGAFNLLLTLSTLVLQLRYCFLATLIGIGVGVLLGDSSLSLLFKKHCFEMKESFLLIKEFIPLGDRENGENLYWALFMRSINSFVVKLISHRSQKTAFTSLTTTWHKCHQVWESWKLVTFAIAPFSSPLSFIGGVVQGQTLASYWKSFYERRVFPPFSPGKVNPV